MTKAYYSDEFKEMVIKEIKKGRTPSEVALDFASQNFKNNKGEPIDRKTINNIITRYKKESGKMIRNTNDGSIFEDKSGTWRYRKIKNKQIIVNKGFKTKAEAKEFQKQFLAELKEKEQNQIEEPIEKKKRGRPKAKITEIPFEGLTSSTKDEDKGFVVIIGKDSNLLNDILTKFNL